jgi:hypothetical protein
MEKIAKHKVVLLLVVAVLALIILFSSPILSQL